jgi:hypothetical protein
MQTITQRFANELGYSDVRPYEVVRIVSDKCIEVRSMNAERDPNWKAEWVSGGFAGHCVNNDKQQWVITSDPDGRVERIRLHRDGEWRTKYKQRFALADEPIRHYDFNF